MGNGVTVPKKEEKNREKEDPERNVSEEEEPEMETREVVRRKCRHFRVVHQSSTGKKYLQIQKWLGEIEITEDTNPLMPLPGCNIQIDLSHLRPKPSDEVEVHSERTVHIPVRKKE